MSIQVELLAVPGPGVEDLAAANGNHLTEHPDLLSVSVHPADGDPRPGGIGIDLGRYGALAPPGHHQFGSPVSREIVDADERIPAAALQEFVSCADGAIGQRDLDRGPAHGEIQGAGLAVEIAVQAKHEGSGGVVRLGAHLGPGRKTDEQKQWY